MGCALVGTVRGGESPAAATAAPAAPPPAVRRLQMMPVISPELQASGQVTFRLRAPKASEVVVSGQWSTNKTAMTKDTNGVWSASVGPVAPGVYEYSFAVDGLSMIDPGNSAIKPMREPRTSILHVPGTPPTLNDFRDVPHGVVSQHTYRSKSLGRLRELAVYTPPGYDQNREATFPTLYLQHGSGDNQATWVAHGKAHWILDNLIAEGKARPMVVVMMDGHAAVPGMGVGGLSNTDAFERDLLEDVMPFVNANYRVKPESTARGIVGLSMGGGQSLTIGLKHTDLFGWVGGFSSAPPSKDAVAVALNAAEETNKRLKLLWIACGKRDFLLQRNEDFVAVLKEKSVSHEWHLTEGDHSWPVWRLYLADFLPRLFQP